MEEYVKRMIDELSQLSERTEKLSYFIALDERFKALPQEEQNLMRCQLNAMQIYKYALEQRLNMKIAN